MRSSSRGSLSSRGVLPSACSASGLRRRRRLQRWCWESLSSFINKQSPPEQFLNPRIAAQRIEVGIDAEPAGGKMVRLGQQRFQQRDGLVLLTRKYIDPGKLVLEVGGLDDVARWRNQREPLFAGTHSSGGVSQIREREPQKQPRRRVTRFPHVALIPPSRRGGIE